jgi:hypothetical protein
LPSITVPNSVTNIGDYAFRDCINLTTVYFQGNCPTFGESVFDYNQVLTIYYLAGAIGWAAFYYPWPVVLVLWNPPVQTSAASVGVRTNQFGFTITGTSGLVIVVEASTNLVNPMWSPVGTNTLTGGSSYFSDPQWTNYPARFYRLRSP